MEENDMFSLEERLEQLSTPELDEMLHAELRKMEPDGDVVRLIFRVLREREAYFDAETIPEETPKSRLKRCRIIRVAAIAAIVGLLLAVVPQKAQAENFFKMLQRWTASFFEFFSPDRQNAQLDYVFETDHPGLQEVHDAAVGLGITGPAVPMWIPEEYELTECKTMDTPSKCYLYACFTAEDGQATLKIDVHDTVASHKYYKDEPQPEEYEVHGTVHYIVRNNDMWGTVWTKDNLECSITIDCQEETLHKIVESIYAMEDE